MKIQLFSLVAILWSIVGYCQSSDETALQQHREFLEQQQLSPVEYIMNLFERYDIVVIGERDHPEITQYDLINQLITSPEFIEKVGHVMTEVGSNNYTKALNEVLCADFATDKQFESALGKVLRECEMQVLWYRTNFWQLLRTIHVANRNLPKSKHLDITLLNPAWSWQACEHLTYEEFQTMEESTDRQNYDVILAENAINAFYEIADSSRKKALIILNVPHHLKGCKYWPYTATANIMARFPGRVANVKLNNYLTHYDQNRAEILPVADGVWDAAFMLSGGRPVGFDLAGTPFGSDGFDGYDQRPFIKQQFTYQDMFDGCIFYNLPAEMAAGVGIPGLVDDAFLPVLKTRYALRGLSWEQIKAQSTGNLKDEFNQVRRYPIWESDEDKMKYDSLVMKHIRNRIVEPGAHTEPAKSRN